MVEKRTYSTEMKSSRKVHDAANWVSIKMQNVELDRRKAKNEGNARCESL